MGNTDHTMRQSLMRMAQYGLESEGSILPHPGRRFRRRCRYLRSVLLQRHPESTAGHPAEGPIHWRLLQARDRTGGQPVLDYGYVEVIGLVRTRMKKEAGAW